MMEEGVHYATEDGKMDTIRRIRIDNIEDIEEEEIEWEDIKPWPIELDTILERLYTFKEKLYNKLKRRTGKEDIQVGERDRVEPGEELTRELEDAWFMFTKGEDKIPSREIGHVLRILGQNPTEDEIVDMVMKANCEWDGLMGISEFLEVGTEILKSSCNQMDDVKAAFRVFDHNNDGSISKDELKEAMVNFGTRCTDEEFDLMFLEADRNNDGKIDFDEFVAMMLPATMMSPESQINAGPA
ncbi:calmodulin-beta [Eurytemora carolleeae]|uniref:calmodulin-beta n=1 Tax=Eurytemora carolleeae TaxID=1294199 RepID=UPI000C772D67|nr:calmodulin-beta [Eurytemora carolleeae]|eukprot:XP_023337806.1 calmodulin-beta-like [Eurytemora affinis]